MKARLAAAIAILLPLASAAANAGESPWNELKQLFHEPAVELKQQFRHLKETGKLKAPQGSRKPASAVAKAPKEKSAPAEAKASEEKPAPGKAEIPSAEVANKTPVPVPEEKPETASPETASKEKLDAPPEVANSEAAPVPRPRPDIAFAYATDSAPLPPEKPAHVAIGALTPPGRSLIVPPPTAGSCRAALAGLGVEASAMAPIHEGGCSVSQPVEVSSLENGAVDFSAKAIVECNLAETFANWIRDEVQPEARKIFGSEVVGLRIAASYSCRPRNNIAGAKLSEHGKGNAIDIGAFNIEGHGWVAVEGSHKGDEARFLNAVRADACEPFTTVLGPGSDSYHSTHFHLDLAKRRTAGPSRGLYCK